MVVPTSTISPYVNRWCTIYHTRTSSLTFFPFILRPTTTFHVLVFVLIILCVITVSSKNPTRRNSSSASGAMNSHQDVCLLGPRVVDMICLLYYIVYIVAVVRFFSRRAIQYRSSSNFDFVAAIEHARRIGRRRAAPRDMNSIKS